MGADICASLCWHASACACNLTRSACARALPWFALQVHRLSALEVAARPFTDHAASARRPPSTQRTASFAALGGRSSGGSRGAAHRRSSADERGSDISDEDYSGEGEEGGSWQHSGGTGAGRMAHQAPPRAPSAPSTTAQAWLNGSGSGNGALIGRPCGEEGGSGDAGQGAQWQGMAPTAIQVQAAALLPLLQGIVPGLLQSMQGAGLPGSGGAQRGEQSGANSHQVIAAALLSAIQQAAAQGGPLLASPPPALGPEDGARNALLQLLQGLPAAAAVNGAKSVAAAAERPAKRLKAGHEGAVGVAAALQQRQPPPAPALEPGQLAVASVQHTVELLQQVTSDVSKWGPLMLAVSGLRSGEWWQMATHGAACRFVGGVLALICAFISEL